MYAPSAVATEPAESVATPLCLTRREESLAGGVPGAPQRVSSRNLTGRQLTHDNRIPHNTKFEHTSSVAHEPRLFLPRLFKLADANSNVGVRSAHLDEVWAGAEDDPMWTLTRVPTWGINGHFGAGSR
jgi:hypothetical protein